MVGVVAAIAVLLLLGLLSRRRHSPARSSLANRYSPEVLGDARTLAGKLGDVFAAVEPELRAGVRTREIDARVRDVLHERGLRSSFLGYHGYQAFSITSINDEAN